MMSMHEKALEDKRLELGNGNFINFRKDPRWGRWKVSYENGTTPPQLKGTYMTYQDAFRAAENYLRNRAKKPTDIIPEGSERKGKRYSESVNAVRREMGLEEK